MDKEQAKILLDRYISGQATAAERTLVESWYEQLAAGQDYPSEDPDPKKAVKDGLQSITNPSRRQPSYWIPATIATAASLIIAGYFSIVKMDKQPVRPTMAKAVIKKDVQAGGNKAFITLANGKKISLTDAKNGKLAAESGLTITKTSDGKLVYQLIAQQQATRADNSTARPSYNIIETPKGGQYQLSLPDGTRIWLNAASSLKYPTVFTGKQRIVELAGEAYFEVAPNREMPFIVKTENQQVKVLGTHFNIKSYSDEHETITTLSEGSVDVSSNTQRYHQASSATLKPGQQSVITADKSEIRIRKADMDTAMGWKNGYIIFNAADIQTIMQQVSRWYNIDVRYEGEISRRTFTGRVPRSSNLSSLLKIMELSNIHFKLEQKSGITSLIIKS
ncbi:FecR family protein [Pedobacter antarcticus]|uniref:FecR family protein n=1 Tax=Pedobacter antarcticus TaxID=34086 RepID=UPI0029312856|nr:FecR domain-containing protein [Pedobacter antarcticus]